MIPPVFRPQISGEIRRKLAVGSRSQSSEDEKSLSLEPLQILFSRARNAAINEA